MAFDDKTRRRLFKTVTTCRNLLTEDFDEQLRSRYGIYADEGSVRELDKLTNLDESERNTAIALRERIEHLAAGGGPDAISTAVHRIRREQAFTILNRLAAVRMAEERKIISQSVGAGLQSTGFRVFEQAAGAALGSQIERYLTYLDCLFDELSLDLGILFDRSDALGLLFPTEKGLRELFSELNDPEIASLWAEDETIGWIYQYYNDPDERKKMRKDSAAPRNSRELAVRNQFFTPRYVVEFLTDNTLGRIWYEMTSGQTRLAEQCRYLVRRPTEIFLSEGEASPETTDQEGLGQEELLKQPVHIQHRPIKDPREIRLLDPACGSMHFGLYAFDLFEVIYEEAWDNGSCPALQEAYASKDDFLKDVPRLIIEHNIHGVDIDPRATQIAGLSLWLRAQKAWQAQGIKPIERPRVRRSNIVCAEPMPGSPEMLEEFIATLDPPLLGELVKTVFDKMQLAGEAGTLLKIEEEIRGAIDTARKAWEQVKAKPVELFSTQELNETTSAPEFTGLETALTTGHRPLTTDFFDTAEQQVIDALRAYAEQADADSYQRRLFADDAARGFAFIDLSRKRYDAVVMNPPFGQPVTSTKIYASENYPDFWSDIYAIFVGRSNSLLQKGGRLGAITASTYLNLSTFEKFRKFLIRDQDIRLLVELGTGVMDDAAVSAACLVAEASPCSNSPAIFANFVNENASEDLKTLVSELAGNGYSNAAHTILVRTFENLPNCIFAYWVPPSIFATFSNCESLNDVAICTVGLHTRGNEERFYRSWWEPQIETTYLESWPTVKVGGNPQHFYRDSHVVVNWTDRAAELKDIASKASGGTFTGHKHYFKKGISYIYTGQTTFSAQPLEERSIFSIASHAIIVKKNEDRLPLLALLNSESVRLLLKVINPNRFFQAVYVKLLPLPNWETVKRGLMEIAEKSIEISIGHVRGDECSRQFTVDWTAATLGVNKGLFSAATDNAKLRSAQLMEQKKLLDQIAQQIFKIPPSDIDYLNRWIGHSTAQALPGDDGLLSDKVGLAPKSLISYFLGSSFGRWDIRYATGERQPPDLPDPFDPLPVCPPGMLQNAEGLPAEPKDVPADYPLSISWPGILVDDENHPEDIVARVRESIEVIWKDRADAIEQEACEILGVKAKPRENLDALRVYFRDPNRFFKDHLARYSKSRRKAPIYWPLSTESGSYTLWIYYHRLDSQTLYTCVRKFIDPKREDLGRDIEALRNQIGTEGTTDERQKLEDLVAFQQELKVFRDQLIKVADMPYRPNLNDGVQITAAPLWECFRHRPWQTILKKTWTELSKKGQYDWAHLAMSMWPERVTPKCATDRSLAIAHGIEDLLWVPDSQYRKANQYRPLLKPEEELKRLEAEHSKEDIEKATKEYEAAKALGLHRTLWVEQPEGTWRRRLTPKQEIESEINRRKGR